VKREFYSLFKSDFDTLQEGISQSETKNYSFNPSTFQFEGSLTAYGARRMEKDATDSSWGHVLAKTLSYDRHAQNTTDATIDAINRKLKVLSYVITSAGGDPSVEIPAFFNQVGIREGEKNFSFFQLLRNRVAKALGDNATEAEGMGVPFIDLRGK